ncbi:hypothetical protein LTR91_012781 [Friedmanniomyces endolithicus]|uniref:Uncharacterized protein n=1 Tax=Friedmanniomyces endolithicus TaxID=329885 RepID=A0AAN6KF18_9PEZI|nr:hypothetical protein LTR59_005640 [Friedmanniomyces endolithicus]KAK0895545.1 hypothetical protein LTR57_022995 [Friedmanniomyces endolithicus]KAK0902408.1 hypothetical protein LTR02_008112 [Friedmanniomyces endolithicus]KAK0978941.1 hypothetical protein LTR91_012781 [Friedmanniomyces endolithicus]KAK0984666.1 hypothetical protein LTS01_010575 [Friedmanniomyces endolithicus]
MLHHYDRQADVELNRLLASQQALLELKDAGSRLVELLNEEMEDNREMELELLEYREDELKKLSEERADEPVNIKWERRAVEENKEFAEEKREKGEQLRRYEVEEKHRMQMILQQLANTSEAISVAQIAFVEAKIKEAEYRDQLKAEEDAEVASERRRRARSKQTPQSLRRNDRWLVQGIIQTSATRRTD